VQWSCAIVLGWVDLSTEVLRQTLHHSKVAVLGCGDLKHGSIKHCLVDVSAELQLHHQAL
jgi:hypothetical protein